MTEIDLLAKLKQSVQEGDPYEFNIEYKKAMRSHPIETSHWIASLSEYDKGMVNRFLNWLDTVPSQKPEPDIVGRVIDFAKEFTKLSDDEMAVEKITILLNDNFLMLAEFFKLIEVSPDPASMKLSVLIGYASMNVGESVRGFDRMALRAFLNVIGNASTLAELDLETRLKALYEVILAYVPDGSPLQAVLQDNLKSE